MLCLLAPAVCAHNKPLLTIKLQPGQLPGERTLIPSPATSAVLELSLYTCLSPSVFPLPRVVKAGPGRRCPETDSIRSTVFYLLPSVFSGHSQSLMPLGSLATHNNTNIATPTTHQYCKLYPEGYPLEEAGTALCTKQLVPMRTSVCSLAISTPHQAHLQPEDSSQSETFTLRAREFRVLSHPSFYDKEGVPTETFLMDWIESP